MGRLRPVAVGLLLLGSACAQQAKLPWSSLSQYGKGEEAPPPLPVASSLPPSATPPRATAYQQPAGATLLATSDGPELGPPLRLSSLAAERFEGRGSIEGAVEADLDGDGAAELLVLVREAEGAYLLAALSPSTGDVQASRRFSPEVDRGRRCHRELRLLGTLAGAGGALPILWDDRGVGCAAFEGGGFEKRILLPDLFGDGGEAILVGRMQLVEDGAVDVYDGIVWMDEGQRRLVFGGVFSARRTCDHGDAPHWVEELALRTFDAAGMSAWHQGARLDLPEGRLPPELLRSHVATCR